ncbi:hypothetical protein THIOM_000210 [Candidatus Thiomargarita nelsonii]|uniref:Uncharacterized protein n=1 Tax=Candidatus Thiomargarita nelsonii TaxID=1003181 RepID=A0A176S791_9GAMM|nr:hypothetical protein THIOM_000210 [Candidatus Thiomargarita nelsonii]
MYRNRRFQIPGQIRNRRFLFKCPRWSNSKKLKINTLPPTPSPEGKKIKVLSHLSRGGRGVLGFSNTL